MLRKDLNRDIPQCAVVSPTPTEGSPFNCKRPIRTIEGGWVFMPRYAFKRLCRSRRGCDPEDSPS